MEFGKHTPSARLEQSIDERAVGRAQTVRDYARRNCANDEIHVFAGGGLRRALGSSWLFHAALTFEHHTTDYELVDRVSGARGSTGSQSAYGITVGISYRFQR